jgi:BlaI family transcriptional regulator, penicillinase repressor
MELTRAEEKVMQVLWKLQKAFVKDIIEAMDEEPKPAYTTVSTIIRILEQKKFVAYTAYGKTHQYHPLITKEQYRSKSFKTMLTDYFEGNPAQVLTYLVQEEKLAPKEIEALQDLINKFKNK